MLPRSFYPHTTGLTREGALFPLYWQSFLMPVAYFQGSSTASFLFSSFFFT